MPNARKCLERSLRLFGSDYIDLLLLHDPSPGSVRSDDVFSFLETARASGLIPVLGHHRRSAPSVKCRRVVPHAHPRVASAR